MPNAVYPEYAVVPTAEYHLNTLKYNEKYFVHVWYNIMVTNGELRCFRVRSARRNLGHSVVPFDFDQNVFEGVREVLCGEATPRRNYFSIIFVNLDTSGKTKTRFFGGFAVELVKYLTNKIGSSSVDGHPCSVIIHSCYS